MLFLDEDDLFEAQLMVSLPPVNPLGEPDDWSPDYMQMMGSEALN